MPGLSWKPEAMVDCCGAILSTQRHLSCLVYSLSSHLPACLPVAPPEDLLETQPHGKPALTRALALLGRTPSAAFTLLLIHWTAGAPAGLSAAPQFDSSVGGTQWDGTLGNLCRPAPPKPSLP